MVVRRHAGVVPVVRVMVSAPNERLLRRYREAIDITVSQGLAVTRFAWEDGRQALGMLRVVPIGMEVHE